VELTLRNRFTQGSRLYYLSTSSVTQKILEGEEVLGSQTAGWKMEIHQRVLEVDPDSSGHVVYQIIPVSLSPEATASGITLHRQVAYMHVDPLGRILEKSDMSPVVPCSFPEAPIQVGDSWDVECPIVFPFLAQPVSYVNRYTLAGLEEVDGVSCARITIHADSCRYKASLVNSDDMVEIVIENEGTVWFDHEDGTLVRLRMTTHAVPTIRGMQYDTLTSVAQQLIPQPVTAAAPC
jgi:hypothetical protein